MWARCIIVRISTDRYTKAVLTVIAACLLWLCVKPLFEPAKAAAYAPQPVQIVGWADYKGQPHTLTDLNTVGLPVVNMNAH